MSYIHYKFKSVVNYKPLTFQGLHISVRDLKKEIFEKEKIDQNSIDLQLSNGQTKRLYTDETELIPRNSSVDVAKIPAITTKRLPKVQNRDTEGVVTKANKVFSPGSTLLSEDLSKSDLPEEEKMKRVMEASTNAYDPSKYVHRNALMTGVPPPTYVCNKCNKTGHWFKNCPLISTKRTTGIPKEELMETTADDPQAMLTSSGKYVVPIMHRAARLIGKKERPPFLEGEEEPAPVQETPKVPVPRELTCEICAELLRDAVLIPCCGNSFCDECIRNKLIEDRCCPHCADSGFSPDSLVPNSNVRQAVTNFENETGYSYAKNAKPLFSGYNVPSAPPGMSSMPITRSAAVATVAPMKPVGPTVVEIQQLPPLHMLPYPVPYPPYIPPPEIVSPPIPGVQPIEKPLPLMSINVPHDHRNNGDSMTDIWNEFLARKDRKRNRRRRYSNSSSSQSTRSRSRSRSRDRRNQRRRSYSRSRSPPRNFRRQNRFPARPTNNLFRGVRGRNNEEWFIYTGATRNVYSTSDKDSGYVRPKNAPLTQEIAISSEGSHEKPHSSQDTELSSQRVHRLPDWQPGSAVIELTSGAKLEEDELNDSKEKTSGSSKARKESGSTEKKERRRVSDRSPKKKKNTEGEAEDKPKKDEAGKSSEHKKRPPEENEERKDPKTAPEDTSQTKAVEKKKKKVKTGSLIKEGNKETATTKKRRSSTASDKEVTPNEFLAELESKRSASQVTTANVIPDTNCVKKEVEEANPSPAKEQKTVKEEKKAKNDDEPKKKTASTRKDSSKTSGKTKEDKIESDRKAEKEKSHSSHRKHSSSDSKRSSDSHHRKTEEKPSVRSVFDIKLYEPKPKFDIRITTKSPPETDKSSKQSRRDSKEEGKPKEAHKEKEEPKKPSEPEEAKEKALQAINIEAHRAVLELEKELKEEKSGQVSTKTSRSHSKESSKVEKKQKKSEKEPASDVPATSISSCSDSKTERIKRKKSKHKKKESDGADEGHRSKKDKKKKKKRKDKIKDKEKEGKKQKMDSIKGSVLPIPKEDETSAKESGGMKAELRGEGGKFLPKSKWEMSSDSEEDVASKRPKLKASASVGETERKESPSIIAKAENVLSSKSQVLDRSGFAPVVVTADKQQRKVSIEGDEWSKRTFSGYSSDPASLSIALSDCSQCSSTEGKPIKLKRKWLK